MWSLVDFLTCWLLLNSEDRDRVYSELLRRNQPRVWRFECGKVRLIGA